jgi:hypothetical protein
MHFFENSGEGARTHTPPRKIGRSRLVLIMGFEHYYIVTLPTFRLWLRPCAEVLRVQQQFENWG